LRRRLADKVRYEGSIMIIFLLSGLGGDAPLL
jgi:hypothetical protein